MLHNALDRAVKERLIVRNPADDCIPPKILKHEMKILPPEQIKSYLTAAEQRGVLPMFYLELISGLSPRPRQHAWNMISLSAWRKASFICKKQTPDTVREGAGHGYTASPDRAA